MCAGYLYDSRYYIQCIRVGLIRRKSVTPVDAPGDVTAYNIRGGTPI